MQNIAKLAFMHFFLPIFNVKWVSPQINDRMHVICRCPVGLWDGCGCHGEWHSRHHDFLLLRGPQLRSGDDCWWAVFQHTHICPHDHIIWGEGRLKHIYGVCFSDQALAAMRATWRRWGLWSWWKGRRVACAWTQSGGRSETTASWRSSGWSTTAWWTRPRLTPDISCECADFTLAHTSAPPTSFTPCTRTHRHMRCPIWLIVVQNQSSFCDNAHLTLTWRVCVVARLPAVFPEDVWKWQGPSYVSGQRADGGVRLMIPLFPRSAMVPGSLTAHYLWHWQWRRHTQLLIPGLFTLLSTDVGILIRSTLPSSLPMEKKKLFAHV